MCVREKDDIVGLQISSLSQHKPTHSLTHSLSHSNTHSLTLTHSHTLTGLVTKSQLCMTLAGMMARSLE